MKISSIEIKKFKRFTDLKIDQIPATAKLIVLTGPNGSGKSSLFEAFHFWAKFKRNHASYDAAYHSKDPSEDQSFFYNSLNIAFHDFNPSSDFQQNRKCFYIRSAYRHEADFTSSGIKSVEDILGSSDKLSSLIAQESRISENYNRIVGEAVQEIFNNIEPDKTKSQIKDRLIGEVRVAMQNLFVDLVLSGAGNPTSGGTFRFNKGTSSDFHFKNLSGGEKAAFDLLLDFIVKKQAFNNTVFCLDEPELHMHTKLQAKLLDQLFLLLPEHCQLWISTHSIGMARKAAELSRANPGQVAFIDFHGQEFDQPATLQPVYPDRTFWKNMFDTALDDLAQLVVPSNVVFCEGRRLGDKGRNPTFDASVYSNIFAKDFPDTEFIPLGGTDQVQNDGKLSGVVLKKLAPGIKTWKVFDRDDRSPQEILDLQSDGVHVLKRRDLESYLWDDEILDKLAIKQNLDQSTILKDKKQELLSNLPSTIPVDDIKAISGDLYNFCKSQLSLTQCGNNAEAFARDTLAPLVTPDTGVYKELKQIIFSAR